MRTTAAIATALALLLAACGASEQSGDKPTPANSSEGATASTDAGKKVDPLPFNASGLLAGTARPNLPDGEAGKVSVVQTGPLIEDAIGAGKLLFAFRNNTGEGISHVDWTATARSGGSIVSTGSSQGGIPAQVQPGEIGLAYIYFSHDATLPPADAEYEFTVKTSPADQGFYNSAPLKVTEANVSGDAIVGAATNNTDESVEGPFSVSVYCFDGDKLLSQHGSFAEQDGPIAADGQVTFTGALLGATCPTFALGVGGWFGE